MFSNPLRPQRSLHKLKKGKSFTWPSRSAKDRTLTPEVDFAAFRSGLPSDDHLRRPLQHSTSVRCAPRITPCITKRDTIFLDLSNKDLIPALDYAFAIIDDDDANSVRSLSPTPTPKMPTFSRGSSADSGDILCTPRTPSSRVSPMSASVRSSPPRYVCVPNMSFSSSMPSVRLSPHKPSARPSPAHGAASSFDPDELSLALAQAQASNTSNLPSPSSEDAVPFPPPPAPPVARVPLLLRKPRMHSADSSMDDHDLFAFRSYPGSSKVSLVARSLSSLGYHQSHDVFAARSTLSLDTPDSALSVLLAQRPPPSRSPYGSLRLFYSKKSRRDLTRRASTPPPSRARLGIPTARGPVPVLSDVFLLGPAARREASSSTPPSLVERAAHARNVM